MNTQKRVHDIIDQARKRKYMTKTATRAKPPKIAILVIQFFLFIFSYSFLESFSNCNESEVIISDFF